MKILPRFVLCFLALCFRPFASRAVFGALLPLLLATTALGVILPEEPYPVEWIRQLGTSNDDESFSVAVDSSGNAYITGYTTGSLGGPNAGSLDAFLTKYDSGGGLLWSQQIGTSGNDGSRSVAVDASGNAYISGYTYGSLGGPNAGYIDAFLTKYDSSGSLLWLQQIGTANDDRSRSVAVDASGNAYISGYTHGSLGGPNAGSSDAFLMKYDSSGSLLWSQQIGTSRWDESWSVAVDASGNAFISGYTYSSLGGTNAGSAGYEDAFLTKYDSSGSLLWSRQIGTSSRDQSYSVAVDASGNAYISGNTQGSLGGPRAGGYDAFLTKYDSSGGLLWSRQIGTSSNDRSNSVAVDASDNVYISGWTEGDLGGTNAGSSDAFLMKYDSSGGLLWSQQIGTSRRDDSYSVAVDASGNAFISGYTSGSLGGTNAGFTDAFLIKFAGSPIPSTVAGRYMFYNDSAFDGNSPGANAGDDAAIATDKSALSAGEPASFENYTNFDGGINGIIVDVDRPSASSSMRISDFEFRVGNNDDPGTWGPAPGISGGSVRIGAGVGGSDRVTIAWPSGAIVNQWLEVTVKANDNTGLEVDDVFYFGNAVGDTGNSPYNARVDDADLNNIGANYTDPAGIENVLDVNRDGRVDSVDAVIVRNNFTANETAMTMLWGPEPSTVAGRYMFYNDSAFDGENAAANAGDDAAIATDKSALSAGEPASFENYTNFDGGINGIIVDVDRPNASSSMRISDFEFRVGNNDDPGTWGPAPGISGGSVRIGAGVDGSDRVTIVWPDGAIVDQWLEVTVKANDNTGLEADDVFYFGNAVGDTGNSAFIAVVDDADLNNIGANYTDPAGIENMFDVNRDGRVDPVDAVIVRSNFTAAGVPMTMLWNPVPEPTAFVLALCGLIGLGWAGRRRW